MRVTLTPQGTGATVATIERDDGVVYAMRGPVAGPVVPHDAVHLLTERELGMREGIWGSIADGAVYGSMTHVSGRRRPHAEERSRELVRSRRSQLHQAELVAGIVERVARDPALERPAVAALARRALSTEPGVVLDPDRVLAAARVLREHGERWRRDNELVVEWSLPRRR